MEVLDATKQDNEDLLLHSLTLEQQIFGSPTQPVKTPEGAIDLFPHKVGPRILYLPQTNQILKAGSSVKMSEAEAMRLVAHKTNIPVPKVQESYVLDGIGYILMSRVEGRLLGHCWNTMTLEGKETVISQLRGYMAELRALSGRFYGALWEQPCEDIFFSHIPFGHAKISYGPFGSRAQYNNALLDALANSRPDHTLGEHNADLAARLASITDETIAFSHGDLHPLNIIIDDYDRVAAIIDWECSGFSIAGRDYFEARARARDSQWRNALDAVFTEEARLHFELFNELDEELVRYTCI